MPEAPLTVQSTSRTGAPEALLALAIFAVATAALYATAPTNLDFWWQDAPRHALDGAFVMDLLKAMPLHDPGGWAMQYYIRYPALTILFYPPAFYAIEAVFFAVLGVSHAVAQLAETPYLLALAMAAYGIARIGLPRWSAIAVGLLAIGTPLSAFWGRQVMLDVPAYATLLAGVWFMLRHLQHGRTWDLVWGCFLLVAAVYTKQTVVFILPAILVGFVLARGPALLLQRRVIVAGIVSVVALIPMAALTWKFGAVNVQSVSGRDGDISRFSPDAWLFYARQLPDQLGWPVLILGLLGVIALILRRGPTEQKWAGPRWTVPFLLTWLIFGYLFFSVIGVREPRHDMMILFPLILCAAIAVHAALRPAFAQSVMAALAAGTFAYSLILVPAPVVSGYGAVADTVARLAPKDAVVLFSGYRDGNFILALRSHTERGDITTVRADKLLLRIAVERERGVGQTDADDVEIARMIHDLGVSLVVAQVDFWSDLRQMARLQSVLNSAAFTPIGDFPITGTLSSNDRSGGQIVRIYRPTAPILPSADRARLDMQTLGGQMGGSLSK